MSKRLYSVTIEKELVVLADDERDANRIATASEPDEEPCRINVTHEIKKERDLPSSWRGDGSFIPHGDDDFRTLDEHLQDDNQSTK